MEDRVILILSVSERDRVVLALKALRDEYNHIADSAISRFLSSGFAQDALNTARLAEAIERAPVKLNKEVMDRRAWDLLEQGNKIEAIKLVRTHTTLGLKEAKDYVEALQKPF